MTSVLNPTTDKRNVQDKYKGWLTELIREDVQRKKYPFSVLMQQLEHDFNIGSVIRNADIFGAKEVFYYGDRKRFDNRGCVGSNHYSHITHLKTVEQLEILRENTLFVALETSPSAIDIRDFKWPLNCTMLIGEENGGLTPHLLDMADYVVRIPMYGAVRSLNAAAASAVAMYAYIEQHGRAYAGISNS